MDTPSSPKPSRIKVREHRDRLRAQGLGSIQIGRRTYAPPPSRLKRSASRPPSSRASMNRTTRPSWTPSRTGAMNELRVLKRGDIWTVASGADYAGKPRHVVIVQDNSFDATDSITICAFTADETEASPLRLDVASTARNGPRAASRLMVDKMSTVPKTKVGDRIGRLDDEDMVRLNRAILVVLGLAASPRTPLPA